MAQGNVGLVIVGDTGTLLSSANAIASVPIVATRTTERDADAFAVAANGRHSALLVTLNPGASARAALVSAASIVLMAENVT